MFFYLKWRSRKKNFNVKLALDIGILSAIMGFLGARLFHAFYEMPEYYRENPVDIIKFWNGGYVFFAGLITAIISGIFVLRWKKQALTQWLDLFAPVLALGYSIGRWACFLQGCCYGKETTSSFGIHFPYLKEMGESYARWPTQVTTSLGELGLYIALLTFENQKLIKRKPGQVFYLWFMGHGINRMLMEFYRDDNRGPLIAGYGVSFWIAFGILFLGTFLLLKSIVGRLPVRQSEN